MKVLLVVDDAEELAITAFALRREGFTVVEASDAAVAIRRLPVEHPDVVVVGLGSASGAGIDALRRIRGLGRTPILVAIEGSGRPEALRCIDLGAEDFIARPYACQELVLRIRAILARSVQAEALTPDPPIEVSDLRLDPAGYMASSGALRVRLTPTEFRICYELVRNAQHVVPSSRLSTFLKAGDAHAANSLRSHICHLRRKLALDGTRHGSITSVPAVGYLFRPARLRSVAPAAGTGLMPVALEP